MAANWNGNMTEHHYVACKAYPQNSGIGAMIGESMVRIEFESLQPGVRILH